MQVMSLYNSAEWTSCELKVLLWSKVPLGTIIMIVLFHEGSYSIGVNYPHMVVQQPASSSLTYV